VTTENILETRYCITKFYITKIKLQKGGEFKFC